MMPKKNTQKILDATKDQVIIRDYKNKDKAEIVKIWSETFRAPSGPKFNRDLKNFQKLLAPRYVIVSELEGKVNGFSMAAPFTTDMRLLDYFNCIIGSAINGDIETLEQMQENWVEKYGGKSQVILHRNRNILSTDLGKNDIYISDIAVEKNMRGKGIGSLLLQESIKKAVQKNTKHLVAMCWNGGYSRQLFSKLGFKPVVTLKPVYFDSQSATYMVRGSR